MNKNTEIIKLVVVKEEYGVLNIDNKDDFLIKLQITNDIEDETTGSELKNLSNEGVPQSENTERKFVYKNSDNKINWDAISEEEWKEHFSEYIQIATLGYNREEGENYNSINTEKNVSSFNINNDSEDDANESKSNEEDENIQTRPKEIRRGLSSLSDQSKRLHTCGICGYASPKISAYKRHLSVHFKPDGIHCGICRKPMETKEKLRIHVTNVHRCPNDQRRYRCHICDFTSKYIYNVSQHADMHYRPDKISFQCARCNYVTTNKKRLKMHTDGHRNESSDFKCPICSANFCTMKQKRMHVRKYRNGEDPSRYRCPECSYGTKRFGHLAEHVLVHRSEHEVDMFLCPKCPFKTKGKRDLKRHIRIRHNADTYNCDFCPYKTKRGYLLNCHMKKNHEDSLVKKECAKCNYNTVSQVLFDIHNKLKHSSIVQQGSLKKCDFCDLEFDDSLKLSRHENTQHVQKNQMSIFEKENLKTTERVKLEKLGESDEEDNQGSLHFCSFPRCSFESRDERRMKIHKNLSHYKKGDDNCCPDCTFHTVARNVFLDHLKLHKISLNDLKTYLCEICGKMLMRKADLTNHMMIHWTGDVPKRYFVKKKRNEKKNNENGFALKTIWECGLCDYNTKMRYSLFRHMAKHGEIYQLEFDRILGSDESDIE